MSLASKLDRGIKKTDYDSDSSEESLDHDKLYKNVLNQQNNNNTLKIKNPFFSRERVLVGEDYMKLIDVKQKQFYYNFNRLYVLCLKNGCTIDNKIYDSSISTQDLDFLVKNMELVETNMKLLNNSVHKSQVILMDSYYLKLFNRHEHFDDKELVIPLFNIEIKTFLSYEKQFTGIFELSDYFTAKITNDFYNNPFPNINYLTEVLKNSESTNYWLKKNNTRLNISNRFINRGFNLSLSQRISDIKLKNVLEELNKMPKEGDAYLSYIYRKQFYVDISSVIKKNGYSLYKIDDGIDVKISDINYILKNISSEYEFYSLTNSLLISKKYCHLVLNNPEYIKKLENWEVHYSPEKINMIHKYLPAFQYAMGYAWLSLYTEECIKKSRITNDDRFVFTIDQASKLPFFPMSMHGHDYRYNPYLSILINNKILDLNNNLMGVEVNPNKVYGVNSLEIFKKRFNIFSTSYENIDILKNINMNNLGISGSVIPACITKYNPLMDKFNTIDRYFQEYYSSSDIDIMCNLENELDMIDKFHEFYNQLSENCKEHNSNIEFRTVKIAALIVNESFIRKNIVSEGMSYEYILSNLDKHDVQIKFYSFYKDYKIKDNFTYINSNKWSNERYNEYFDISPIENIRIVFARTKKDWANYWDSTKTTKTSEEEKNTDDLEDVEKEYYHKSQEYDHDADEYIDEENVLFKVYENIKFKVKGSILNHEIEFFKIKYPTSFFSTVSAFHLPCVRGYYDGSQVYLLPSCITAAMTLVNMDYKYFAGSKDPIEIINKYRMRGYSLPINDSEKIRFTSYSSKVDKWNKLYGNINLKNKDQVNSVYGFLRVTHNFFNPRNVLKESFVSDKVVSFDYNNINEYSKLSYNEMLEIHYPKFNRNHVVHTICNLISINENGYINQVKKWYFDAIYDKC